jgi:hypothetical protein
MYRLLRGAGQVRERRAQAARLFRDAVIGHVGVALGEHEG